MVSAVRQDASETPSPTRVVVVDDHVMFAELLARSLAEHGDLVVTAVFVDPTEVAHASVSIPFDLAVVDYHMRGVDGIVVAMELAQSAPNVRVILLDSARDEQVLRDAVAAGCAGYLTKLDPVDALVQAIRTVASGGLGFDAQAIETLASSPTRDDRAFGLTEREYSVLRLLANGASTPELAERLFVSPTTARNHVQRVMNKLGAHSRLEAVAIAARAGLIPLGGDEDRTAERAVPVGRSA